MFSQIEQKFSHIIRTRFAVSFILMLALPIAAGAQEVIIESSPTSIMEGNTATFIISVTPAPTRNLTVNIEVSSGGPVFPDNYTRPTTITIGTSGQATLTVPTRDFTEVPPPRPTPGNPNPAQNANWGSVRVTIKDGTGYTIGEQGSASVYVIDEDADENPPTTVAPLPVLTLYAAPTRVAIDDVVTVTIKRTEPYDKRHRVDFRVSGHLPDITDWEPMVEILHQESANRHPPGERTYSFRVQEETCGHTPGRKIEAYLFDAYYYGDNLGINPDDAAYKVGDPSSVTIDVYAPLGWQPTGAPTISGTLDVDEELTVSHGLSGVTTIQWIRVQGSTEINIGTGNTYTIVSADNDHRLKVKVTFNDGTCEIESALTGVVGGETPVGTIVGNPPSITEGQSKRFKITMTPAPTAPLNAEVRVSQIGDFITGSPGVGTHTVNFSTNQATATITVATDNDNIDELDGEISVELLSRTGYKVGNPAIATVIVKDNDNPRLRIEAGTLPITEGDNAEFTITADPAPATPLTVTVSVSENRDFISDPPGTGTRTVNFNSGDDTATLTVATDDDDIDELDGQIRAQLQSATDYDLGSPSSATVTVNDNDMPQLSIGADQTVAESAGSMEFTVTLDGPNAQTVTVDYTTSDGTAIAPGDYTQRSGRLTFSPSGARTQTIRVTIRNDDIDETNENFTVTLSNANNATMGRDEATGTITDDDTRGVRVDPTALNVPENGNNTYTVVLTSQPTENVTVTVGGATGDVSVSGSPLVFTTSNWRNSKTVRVNAADDTDSDSDPPVTLTHTVTGGDYAGELADPVVVTIVENDISTLSIDNASASESVGTMSFTVRLSVASTQPVTVNYATSNGTAIAPGDYTANNGTLTFPASSTASQTISVTIENDDIDEDNETFTVRLSNASSNAMLAGGGSTLSATGTIQDNDTRGVRVSPTALTVNEGSSNTYTVQLLSEPTNTVAIGVSVTDNTDVSADEMNLTFTTNTWNTAQTVTVSADQDTDSANDVATVQHTVSDGDYGANNVTAASVRVTVDDDETPGPPPIQQPPQPPTQQPPTQQPIQPPTPGTLQVTISAGTSPVTEGTAATFTVTASPAPITTLTVNVNVTQTDDVLSGTPDATVTIGTSGQATLTVATDDDQIDEPNSEVTAELQGGTGYTVGSPSSATVTVEDNDAPGTKGPPLPEMTITANRASVTEGTAATFTVTADPAPTTAITVSVNVSETEDVISGTSPSTVTIGTTGQATLTVATHDDDADEDDSVVTAQLETGTGYIVGTPSSANVTVEDNDAPGPKGPQPPQMTITANNIIITEGTAATFTITANPAPTTAVTVNVNVSETEDVISGTPPSTATFKANQTTATLTVATDDDDVDESHSIVKAELQAGTGYTVGTPNLARALVNDNDATETKGPQPPQVTITADTSPITEGTAATFTITANPAPTTALKVKVSVSETEDVISGTPPASVTFSANQTTATLTVNTENDQADEPNSIVTARLQAGTGYTLGTPSSASVTVNDNDILQMTITADPPSVTEGEDATFTITATPAPTTAVTVNITITETGNTLSGTPPATVTFSANETTATLTVATDDDNTDEDASVITAQLQDGTGYTVGDLSSARVLVLDDELPPSMDAALSNLTISPGKLKPVFDPATLSYTASVVNAVSTVTVTATANNAGASVSINGQNTTTLDVSLVEGANTITVTVTAVDNSTQLTYTITVTRAAPVPQVTITANRASVTEGMAATFTITASPAPTAALKVKVNVSEDGKVLRGTPASSVTFKANQTTATLTVTTHDDKVDEDASTITAQLQTGTGYTVGTPSSASVTVNDNDIPQVTITADPPSVTEGEDATFTITATPAPTTAVTVNITITETGNTLSGTPPATVTFSANETTATLTVATDDDNTDEDASVITAQLQDGTGYTVGDLSSARVLVLDDELPPSMDAALSNLTISPGKLKPVFDPATLSYTASVVNAVSTVTVTATANNAGASVSINGQNTTTLDVSLVEGANTITVTVTAQDNSTQLTYTITVTRAAPGVPQVTITTNTTSVTEGEAAAFTITADPAPTTAVTVNVNVTQTGNVFSGTPKSTVTINPNETTATLTVHTVNDQIDEPNSIVTAQLQDGTGYVVGDPFSASASVLDNDLPPSMDATLSSLTISPGTLKPVFDPATLSYTASVVNAVSTVTVTATANNAGASVSINGQNTTTLDVSLVEGANTITVTVTAVDNSTQLTYTITVTRAAPGVPQVTITTNTTSVTEGEAAAFTITADPAPTTAVTVNVNVTQTGNVFSGTPKSTVTINPNETTATLTVHTVNDQIDEPNSIVTAQLQDGTGYVVGDPFSASASVLDNDLPPSMDATLSSLTISPGKLKPVFDPATLSYTASVVNAVSTVTVTATANNAGASVSINGQNTTTLDVSLVEGANTITVTVTAVDNSTQLTYTITVTRAAPVPQVTITANRASVTEGMAATFTITASPAPTAALKVKVNVSEDGKVLRGTPASSVTFKANQTTATLTVTTHDDKVDEDASTITAQLQTGTGYTVGTPSSASVTVNDNDIPQVTITADPPSVTEGEDATFTITATPAPTTAVTVNITITETGNTLSGTPPATVTFSANETTATLTVATDDDNTDEDASVITAQLQSGTGYTVGTPSSATVTVNDNDMPQVTITANPASVTEGTATTFTIRANPVPATALTVNVNVTQTEDVLSGTPPSTITFNAKQTTVTLTVATDDDDVREDDSEVTAQVQVGTGYTVGTPSSASITVKDNDTPPNSPAAGAPIIIGKPELDETLTADVSNIRDANGLTNVSYSYQWIRVMGSMETQIPGATGSTYEVATDDSGHQLKVRVNFTDDLDYPEELESALTAMVVIPGVTPVITITADPPSVTEGMAATFTITATPAPTITLTVNVSVTETANTLSGTPPSTVTISAGHTTATLTVATHDDDVDEHASMVKARLQAGTGYTIGDPSSASVLVMDDEVTISTDATLSSLTINPGVLNPAFDPETLSYTASVPNADSTITVTTIPNNEGATISLNGQNTTSLDIPFTGDTLNITITVTAEDNTTQLTYTITVTRQEPIPNRPATGAPTISGTPEVGELLTADVSNIADADGLENVAYTYQWIRVMNGEETEIPNATSSTYEVVTADIGHQLKVRVNFTDDAGHAEELESALTSTVAAPVVTPVLAISANPTTITEGTAATFTITTTPAPTTAITVSVSVTQTEDVLDGTPPSTTTINANETTATLTVATRRRQCR